MVIEWLGTPSLLHESGTKFIEGRGSQHARCVT